MTDTIKNVGPGDNYLCEPSTVASIRGDEWCILELGVHGNFGRWKAEGGKDFFEELKDKVDHILNHHKPLPLDADVEKGLNKICKRAK